MTVSVHPAAIECHEGMVCDPGWADLTRRAVKRVDQVETRWAHRPYTVLLVTGVVVDVIEAPPHIAEALLRHLHLTGRSVIAVETGGRVQLLLGSGPAIDQARTAEWARSGVLFHQRGSWIVLPPSIIDGARTRWLRPPKRPDSVLPPAPEPVLSLLDQTCPPRPSPARGVVCMSPHLYPPRPPQSSRGGHR